MKKYSDLGHDIFSRLLVLGIVYSSSCCSAIVEIGSENTEVFTFGFPFAAREGVTLVDVANRSRCKLKVGLVYPEIQRNVRENRIEVVPLNFSMVHRFLESYISGKKTCAICVISDPSPSGMASLGCDTAYTRQIMEKADLVIGEINHHQPRTFGEAEVDVSRFDAIVETDEQLPLLVAPKIGPNENRIGEYVAELVDDRSTIQLGIGSIPQAIANNLINKNDLGFHSGLFSDLAAMLTDKGVLTNKFKETGRGKSVACLAFGCQPDFYDWIDHNESLEMRPSTFTHDRSIISQISNFVAINSAIQVDLLGQVNAETLHGNQLSGVGGQMDFNVGARLSRDGKSIIALESTTREKESKIVPFLDQASVVTTPRSEIDYVVTEYGSVKLEGKSRRERALALIEIAHPDFHQELKRQAATLSLI